MIMNDFEMVDMVEMQRDEILELLKTNRDTLLNYLVEAELAATERDPYDWVMVRGIRCEIISVYEREVKQATKEHNDIIAHYKERARA